MEAFTKSENELICICAASDETADGTVRVRAAYARFALEELKEEACVRFTAEVIREERSRSGYDLHLLDVEILSEPEEVPPVVINQKRVNTSIENLLDYRLSRCEMKKSARFSRFRPGSVRRSANFWMDSTSPKSTHRSS